DLRAEPDIQAFRERVVDAGRATCLTQDDRAAELGGNHPFVQTMAGVAERSVERDALAGPEPVQGDREVVDTDLGHGYRPFLFGSDWRGCQFRRSFAGKAKLRLPGTVGMD